MRKGANNRRKRTSVANKYGISAKKYNELKREARNARQRLQRFEAKTGLDASIADAFLFESLLQRVASGEKPGKILREVKALRGEKLNTFYAEKIDDDPSTVEINYSSQIRRLVNKANRAIDRAKTKYAGMEEIFPKKLDFKTVIGQLTEENYESIIADLKSYTAEKLKPYRNESYPDITTKFQYEKDLKVIEEENKRRLSRVERFKQGDFGGGVLRQEENALEPIDFNKIASFRELHRRALTWSEEAVAKRSNQYLDNYLKSLTDLEIRYINSGLHNDVVSQRFAYIRSVIEAVRGNVELTHILSLTFLNVDIQLNYKEIDNLNFAELYNDFADFADEYLDDWE